MTFWLAGQAARGLVWCNQSVGDLSSMFDTCLPRLSYSVLARVPAMTALDSKKKRLNFF